jgi:alanine racemase
VVAVIKTDGYGHGAVPVAHAIHELVDAYAVATIDEALNLRNHQLDKPIYVIGYTHPSRYEQAIQEEIRLTIYSYEDAELLNSVGTRIQKKGYVHIKLDTGMNRIGFQISEEARGMIKQIYQLPYVNAEGIFTHFASADEADKTKAYEQLERFQSFIGDLEQEGVSFAIKHCSNSAALMELPEANLDAVRAGIAMYGLYPSSDVNHEKTVLQPALEMKTHIIHLKELEPGMGVSYGGTYVTEKKTKVATIPVGYGDGYRRSLSNRGSVLIGGKRAPILGRICMDQFMVDVSEIPNVKVGDMVTLIGKDGDDCITVEEMATLAGETFNYEIVCDLGKRIPRVFYHNGTMVGTKDYFDDSYDIRMFI